MTELNDLFEQIFHSERNFKARIDHLKSLSGKTQECQFKLKQSREELHTKQGELAVKNSRLADIEVEVDFLQLRKGIIQAEENDLTEDIKKISKELDITVREVDTKRRSFKDKLIEFSLCYDLHGSGAKYREEEARKQVASLQDELILLETEMVEIGSYLEDVTKLQKELNDAESELKQEKDRENELKVRKIEQEHLIQKLKNEKTSNSKASSNSDLKRLQSELDACKNSHEEETCKRLKKELEELQKACYYKQMKLQIARQNRTSDALSRKRSRQCNHKFNSDYGMEIVRPVKKTNEVIIVDDEWLTAEDLDNDEVRSEDSDWDIDDIELEMLEQNLMENCEDTGVNYQMDMQDRSVQQERIYKSSSVQNCKDFPANHNSGSSLSSVSASSLRSKREQRKTEKQFNKPNRLPPLLKEIAESASSISIASPDSNLVPRKRPGESIFKLHGTQGQTSSGIKTTKKVRFQY